MAAKWIEIRSRYFHLEGDQDVITYAVLLPTTPHTTVRWRYNVHGDSGLMDTEREAKAHAEKLVAERAT